MASETKIGERDPNWAGGPAFPVSIPGVGDNGWHGMTLRDYFAGQALAMRFGPRGSTLSLSEMACHAYQMADAMLAARAPTAGDATNGQ